MSKKEFVLSGQVQYQTVQVQAEEKWSNFNQKLQVQTEGKIPPPFPPVETLTSKYLKQPSLVLDIGCETGKTPHVLLKAGIKL